MPPKRSRCRKRPGSVWPISFWSPSIPRKKISRKEWNRLWKAGLLKRVEEREHGKGGGIAGTKVMAELHAKYGQSEARAFIPNVELPERLKRIPRKPQNLSPEEWGQAWMKELKTRLEEIESGEDPGVPLDDVLKFLEKPARKLLKIAKVHRFATQEIIDVVRYYEGADDPSVRLTFVPSCASHCWRYGKIREDFRDAGAVSCGSTG